MITICLLKFLLGHKKQQQKMYTLNVLKIQGSPFYNYFVQQYNGPCMLIINLFTLAKHNFCGYFGTGAFSKIAMVFVRKK